MLSQGPIFFLSRKRDSFELLFVNDTCEVFSPRCIARSNDKTTVALELFGRTNITHTHAVTSKIAIWQHKTSFAFSSRFVDGWPILVFDVSKRKGERTTITYHRQQPNMKSSLLLCWIVSFHHIGGSGALASYFRPKSSSSRLKPPSTGVSSSSSTLPMAASKEQEKPSPPGSLGHPPEVPSLAQYRKFALPCLGLWIAGPLLSLVDTAFIGLSGPASQSAQQLAALGPATTFFDGGKGRSVIGVRFLPTLVLTFAHFNTLCFSL